MYVYLIGHSSHMNKIHTCIGKTPDFENRLREHNESTNWFPLMVIETACPVLASTLESEWRQVEHDVEKRIIVGFRMVLQNCLTCYVVTLPIGLLSQMPEGDVKHLPSAFWESL